jgi:hypothetical protein
METPQEDILDPAHRDDGGVTNVGAAGIVPPEPQETVTPDGNILERDGHRYVREEALHNERQERQRLSKTVAALEPLMPELEEFLKGKQARQNAVVGRVSAPSGDRDYSDDELEGLAITRGYYQQDGVTPDLKRAESELNILTRVADRRAARQMRPLSEQTTADRAASHRSQAMNAKFVDGEPIADPKYLQAAFDALPKEYTADPNVANITQVIAMGLEYADMRRNGTFRRGRGGRDPMMVERGGGRIDSGGGEMSELDRAAARARGKSPEGWAKMTKAVGGSRSGVLEDI